MEHAILVIIPLILSLTVHEYCHAGAAYLLNDQTAARMGRLTLNPIPHIDPIGTLVLPLVGALTGGFLFGWAKPVPVQPYNFTRSISMRKGMLLVSLAGPASNMALALLASLLLFLLIQTGLIDKIGFVQLLYGQTGDGHTLAAAGIELLKIFIQLNIILAFFNMIPVPPLDGSKILAGILPYKYGHYMEFLERYGFIILIVLLFSGVLNIVFYPASLLANLLLTWPLMV